MTTLSRRQREQLRHQDEILIAAGDVFAQKGFFNTTMEDIAQASQFAIGSLYKHFRNKDALFGAMFKFRLSGLVDSLEGVVAADAPFSEGLDAFLFHYAEFAHQNSSFLRILTAANRAADWHSAGVREAMEPVLERYRETVLKLVTRGLAEGTLTPLPAEDLASYTMGVLHSFFHVWLTSDTQGDFRQKTPVIRALLLGGIALRDGQLAARRA